MRIIHQFGRNVQQAHKRQRNERRPIDRLETYLRWARGDLYHAEVVATLGRFDPVVARVADGIVKMERVGQEVGRTHRLAWLWKTGVLPENVRVVEVPVKILQTPNLVTIKALASESDSSSPDAESAGARVELNLYEVDGGTVVAGYNEDMNTLVIGKEVS